MIEIRVATWPDARTVAHRMRPEDAAEFAAAGTSPRRAVRELLGMSLWARTAWVDGEPAAIWGLYGALLSDEALVWLATTAVVERVPLQFVRHAAIQVADMMRGRRRLSVDCAASYTRSLRLWRLLGFQIGEPRPLPPTGRLFCEVSMVRPWACPS